MKITKLFKKIKFITVSVTPLNRYEINNSNTLRGHTEETNSKGDIVLIQHRTYAVRKGCTIKLRGYSEANTKDVMLVAGEQFFVKAYTGYDIYGEDYVIYHDKEYILRWDSNVQKLLKDCDI